MRKNLMLLFVVFAAMCLYCLSCARGISTSEAASGKQRCGKYLR